MPCTYGPESSYVQNNKKKCFNTYFKAIIYNASKVYVLYK